MRPIPAVFLLAVLLSAALVACSPKSASSEPNSTAIATGTSATPGPDSTPADQPLAATSTPSVGATADEAPDLSIPSVPRKSIRFRVQVPENTPPGDSVYLMVHSVDIEFNTDHVELQPDGAGFYSGEVSVDEGGLLRYAYDRWDGEGCCEMRNITREALFTGDPTGYRLLHVVPGQDLVEDVVPQWNDLQVEFDQVEVSGRVIDAESNEPLMDVEVTIGGIHVATGFDGKFTVPGIAPGQQRVVAYTVKGNYGTAQQEFEQGADRVDGLEIRLKRAEIMRVEFLAHLPPKTPADSGIFISGNLWQLGGRPAGPNRPAVPSGISMPIMSRNGNVARFAVDLPVGAYVEYFYTLGSDVVTEGHENDRRYRSFVVGGQDATRTDAVTYWGNEGWPLVTIRVDVPVNTPNGVPVYLRTGPTNRMNQTGPTQWVTVVGSHPSGSEYRYGISLGDDMHGTDGSPDLDETGDRSFTISGESTEIAIKVSKWTDLPDPTLRDDRNGLTVKFRLSVPNDTPDGATIVITGDRPALGAKGTTMQPVPGNPWLYEAKVNFGHDGPLRYRYTETQTGFTSDDLSVQTDFHGQEMNDFVTSWDGAPTEAREGWVSGIFTPDFWSEAFLPSSASAFDAAREANGEWVVISSVWSFGQIQPEPFLESRPVRIWTVLTPIEDIRAQAAVAREKGLKVFLGPQMNPEVIPNWQDETVSAGSREWWDQWLEQAETQWMWNAVVAEEIEAEMLMLPGYVFHVFPPPFFFLEPEYVPEFDLKVQDLIGKVRNVYSGKILISGGQTDYDFPGLADYVGVTTYDLGVPELPADASFADLQGYYAPLFEAKVDPLWERWGKPVMFYTIHAPSKPQEGDEFGQLFQAAAYEAMFQQIAIRPHVIGSFTWAFDMVGAWQFETDGVRDRAAEAVMAKWYELLGGS